MRVCHGNDLQTQALWLKVSDRGDGFRSVRTCNGLIRCLPKCSPPQKNHTHKHTHARARKPPQANLSLCGKCFECFRFGSVRLARSERRTKECEQSSHHHHHHHGHHRHTWLNRTETMQTNGDRSNRATGRLNSGVIETQLCLSLIILFGLDVSASAVYISGVRGFFFSLFL